jgi:DNA-binding MarR family transcriptional regulator
MSKKKEAESSPPSWTFLTNHSHVLICLARDTEIVMRDIAILVGITERAVQRIVADLEEAGYLERFKEGRKNIYKLALSKPLRHPIERTHNVSELVRAMK